MSVRTKLLTLIVSGALTSCTAIVQAQLFSDGDFLAAGYTTSGDSSGDGNQVIDFNVDYSNYDVFGDGFLTVSLPEAPNSSGGAATTGVFLSANNSTILPGGGQATGSSAFSSISPNLANLNVGTGTSNPSYKVTVDVFHSSAAGFDDGSGGITQTGSTNQTVIGLNQTNTTVQVQNLNSGGVGLSGQGLALSVTGDTGSSDDYIALYGGARYVDRDLGEVAGESYTQASNNATGSVTSGLIGRHLNDYWEGQGLGFEFDDTDSDPTNNLNRFTGNATTFAPDPNDLANYYTIPQGETDPVLTTFVQPKVDAFPEHNDPLHYTCGAGPNCGLTGSEVLAGNDSLFPGVPYNAWSTHELYWVDEEFTYVIDGVPVLQFKPDNDGLDGDDNIFKDFSDAGTVVLGFWDRFSSISINPEGANFVVYDNLVVEAASSGDAPVILEYLNENGYLLPNVGNTDTEPDGDVDGADFLSLQRNNPSLIPQWQLDFGTVGSLSSASAVPEPCTIVLLIGLSLGMISQRRH